MAIIRQKRKKRFSIVDNDVIEDQRLSYKARGLLIYMLSKPDDWKFYPEELAKHSDKDGVKAVNSALQEIETAGYLTRKQDRDQSGHFKSVDYLLSEVPQEIDPQTQNRQAGKRQTDQRQTANGGLPNTDFKPNTDVPNTELDDDDTRAHASEPAGENPFDIANSFGINVNSGTHLPIFIDFIETLGSDVVAWAVHRTVDNAEHPSWSYLLTTLKGLEANNVRSVEQAEKLSEEYKEKRQQRRQGRHGGLRIGEEKPPWMKKAEENKGKETKPWHDDTDDSWDVMPQ